MLQAVNSAGAQLLGMAAQVLTGQPPALFLQPGDSGALLAAVQTAAPAIAPCAWRLRAAAGATCRVQAVARAGGIAGQMLLMLVPVTVPVPVPVASMASGAAPAA